MTTAIQIISAIATPLIVGIALAVFNKRYNKKSSEVDKRAELRKEESFLALKMANANGALAYAAAIAIRDKKTNGETKDAIEKYEDAKQNYYDFINRQHFDK